MQVILKTNIHNLGGIGDLVDVKSGYGRNYLLPQGLAVPATSGNIKEFEAQRAELEKKAAADMAESQKRADAISKIEVTIPVRVGEEGKLYGSIGTKDIAEAITAAGHQVNKSEVLLPEGAIRETGEFEVGLQLHGEVRTTVKVKVIAEE